VHSPEIKLFYAYFMNIKNFITFLITCLLSLSAFAQHSINGNFPSLAGQQVKLVGFQAFGNYAIDSTRVSEQGDFALSYTDKDLGSGYLTAEDNKPFIVILSGENIKLKGESFIVTKTIQILEGEQNQLFEQYASEHARREQALSAWGYLTKIYTQDSLFATHKVPQQAIEMEKQRIKAEDSLFFASLNSDSYVSYYLPLRKLVSSVSDIAQYKTDEIPATITSFRKIDYTDPRLHKSGLLADVIKNHFWLIENSGLSLDSVFIEMNKSIDVLVENLLSNEQQLNVITEYLFKLLEKRSFFKSSEYLALKLLNELGCTINSNFTDQLESYRVMKKGNIASDFILNNDVIAPGYEANKLPKKLSDIKNKYTVVVFGASWCPACPQELSTILGLYTKWKAQDVEVVFVSLDQDEKIFKNFAGIFPFISICDYQKWESPIVQNYHVFATPTIYLLNSKREILLRPNSVRQIDSWVDWYLVQGNINKPYEN
jgi:thiol-disulfide isomerase/thioredoxin